MATGAYASKGHVGVLTPQANTTVEAELWALLPSGTGLLNARLTSDKATITDRLRDYADQYETACAAFANAPLVSIAAACTGASYLIGKDAETALAHRISHAHGVPFLTAALATVAALRQMNATRLALLSPYPDSLNAASKTYWQSHGFDVVAVAGPAQETEAFHPIYAMADDGVSQAYAQLSETHADAVVMLGTGMPSLRPLLQGHARGWMPAISCNVALMWAASQGRAWEALDCADIEGWRTGALWRDRLDMLFPHQTGA